VISTNHKIRHPSSGQQATVDPTAFYNALWDNPNYSMYVLDVVDQGADFRFVAFNDTFKTGSPIDTSSIQDRLLSEAFSAEVFDIYHHRYHQCVVSKQHISFEERLPLNNRTTYWQFTVCPLCDDLGKVSQLLAICADITSQEQDRLLLESQEILQHVIDTIPAAVFWKDTDSRYLGCNRAFVKMAGLSEVAELVGKDDYDMVWKKEEADWFRECDRQIMAADKAQFNIIEPQLQAKGRQAWLRTSKIPLHDSDGKVNGILGVIEDITDRKETQDKQARLLAILEATPDIISITDACGYHRYLNQAGQRMFDTSSKHIHALNLTDLMLPGGVETSVSAAFSVARKQGIWAGESTIRNCRGRDIPVSHVIISHPSEEGVAERFSSIMRDISDRKAAETQLKEQSETLSDTLMQLRKTQAQIIQAEKMSSLGQMVAGVAHEINNPVNFIHGNLEPACLYTEELLDLIDLYSQSYAATPEIQAAVEEIELDFVREDLPKLLDSMVMGTERIREIVLSLRNFSRLDESAMKTVDLHEGIDSTLVILNHRLKTENGNQAIEVIKQYGELPAVSCYPSQLNQVLMNILSNAIYVLRDHTMPRITITTHQQNSFVNIRIEDNGPGIPKDIQAQVFDPFFTTKPVGQGTGMGMSVSYQIITEKHGGQLTFTSKEGQGTTFSISIPTGQFVAKQFVAK